MGKPIQLTDSLREQLVGQVSIKFLKESRTISFDTLEECGIEIPDELLYKEFGNHKIYSWEYDALNELIDRMCVKDFVDMEFSPDRSPSVLIKDHHVVKLKMSCLYELIEELNPLIGNLTELRELYLHHNHIIHVPESIGDLTKLRRLYLHNNYLSSLPDSIGNLECLSELSLANNNISHFPKSMKNLKRLERMSADREKLDLDSIKILNNVISRQSMFI